MNISVCQISSLEKVRPSGFENLKNIKQKVLMKGESFSYQIAMQSSENLEFKVETDSPIKDFVKIYFVHNAVMDLPTYKDYVEDDDYITKDAGLMPDILVPAEDENFSTRIGCDAISVWVKVDIPGNMTPGVYPVNIKFNCITLNKTLSFSKTMQIEVIDKEISKQKTIFTQWFHTDCIANYHNVEVYSEEHWNLIDKYMNLASDLGINMLLTPIITPPLDTEIGHKRTNVQLVKIEKKDNKYTFDFSRLKRWISLLNKNNIKYIEMSHLFSQWGLKCAPNIVVKENGEDKYLFGWHVDSKSDEYKDFLYQFLPALISFVKEEGVKDRCWFHISDEPKIDHIENYKYAHEILKNLIDGCPTLDALSNYNFYKSGYIKTPVTSSSRIDTFLQHKVDNQWVYYCCSQHTDVGNRFIAMPSYRNRILGLQIYKYNIKGFLHWGYNFFNNQYSRRPINPYITTSADKGFPSGDSFSVYPTNYGAIPSLRAIIFKEALQDIEICRTLEGIIGREKVIEMIDDEAGMNITFKEYPRNNDYVPTLIEKMENIIKENI